MMRRGRSLREYRSEHLRQKKVQTISEQREKAQSRLIARKKKKIIIHSPESTDSKQTVHKERKPLKHEMKSSFAEKRRHKSAMAKARHRTHNQSVSSPANIPSSSPLILDFQEFSDFIPSKHINICHVIESLGLGGAQTMLAELVGGLDKYYGKHITNYVVALSPKKQKAYKDLFLSYHVNPIWVGNNDFRDFLNKSNIDIVLHHRIAISRPIQKYLPKHVKYILLNHTWNSINRVQDFTECDVYVSVCDFLSQKTKWNPHIHDSRKLTILNGIENDYIKDIQYPDIAGDFKTGRCHRMVSAKFKSDSFAWMNRKIAKSVDGFHHHFIGTHPDAKAMSKKYPWLTYHGTITDRDKKMGIIKQFDAYFYETFGDEGASIAILESIAAGVPVLAKPLGGTPEILRNGVNGFVCPDRTVYELRLKQLASGSFPKLRSKTLQDFEDRLHVKHTACKYVQLFESLL